MADAVRVVMLISQLKPVPVRQANMSVLHHRSCSERLPRIVKGRVPDSRRFLLMRNSGTKAEARFDIADCVSCYFLSETPKNGPQLYLVERQHE